MNNGKELKKEEPFVSHWVDYATEGCSSELRIWFEKKVLKKDEEEWWLV